MTARKVPIGILIVVVAVSLAACSDDTNPSSAENPTSIVVATITPTNLVPTSVVAVASATSAESVSSPAPVTATAPTAVSPGLPEGVTLEERSEPGSFPTPDVEKSLGEMGPAPVIIEGVYPYPTANASIDSDGDRRYTLEEWKQAIRETYPAYDWPEAYTPSVDDVLDMMSMDMFPPGSLFEVPMELVALGNVYQCAWQQNWIDAFGTGNQQEMDISLKHLRATVLTNPVNIDLINDAADMFNRAELGDPSLMLRHVQRNCVGFNRWVKSRSSVVPMENTPWGGTMIFRNSSIPEYDPYLMPCIRFT